MIRSITMHGKPLRSVLYVDDDPDICEVVVATLSAIGQLETRSAASGSQAVLMLDAWKPDLVLMDVMMPGLDGPSTLKQMHGNADTAAISVIFMTAKVLPVEVAHFQQLGAIGVISKPFDPLTLPAELIAICNGSVFLGIHAPADVGGRGRSDPLSQSFIRRTARDILGLDAAMERGYAGDRSALLQIERVAHSIHGGGFMFGFSDLGAAAGDLERLVQRLAAGTRGPSRDMQRTLLGDLMGAVARLEVKVRQAEIDGPRSAGLFHA